jgi:hypothetical protein
LPVGLGAGEDGVGLELGQQRAAVAGADVGGLGQPDAGDGPAGGDQGGIRLAGALALARLLPGSLPLGVRCWVGGWVGVRTRLLARAKREPVRSADALEVR